jgi:hypothetical protein
VLLRCFALAPALIAALLVTSPAFAGSACEPTVSSFWQQRAALCQQARTWAASATPETPVDPQTQAEVLVLCETEAPELASLTEAARLAGLAALAPRLGARAETLGASSHVVAATSRALLSEALEAASAVPNVEVGFVGDAVVDRFRGAGCALDGVNVWLSTTCGDSSGGLRRLRQGLLLDLAQLPAHALASGAASNEELRFLVALLDVLDRPASVFAVARALEPMLPESCVVLPAIPPSSGGPGSVPTLVGLLFLRLLQDDTTLAHPDAHYVRAVEQVLRDSGVLPAGAALSPEKQVAALGLVAALRRAQTSEVALGPARGEVLRAEFLRFAGALVDALEHASTLAGGQSRSLGRARAVVVALVSGEPTDAARAVLSVLPPGAIPEAPARVLGAATRLVVARSESDAKAAIRDFIVPDWLTGLILDVGVGTPIAGTNEFSLDLEGSAGWEAKRWGFWLGGSRRIYDATLGGRDITEADATVQGRGWVDFQDLSEPWGLAAGVDFGVDQFVSDLTLLDATAITSDEISQVVRGSVTGALWLRPTPTFVARLSLAGGLHREFYTRDVTIPSGPEAGFSSVDDQSSSGDYRARALLVYRIWPDILRASLQGRAEYHEITRSKAFFSYAFGGTFATQSSVVSAARLELAARLLLELEALTVGDLFRPGAFVEIAHISTDDGQNPVRKTLPSVGIGIRSHLPD